MADADVVRQRILASIFNRKSGNDDAYVSHLRIWEDTDDGTEKSRYIILAQTANGSGLIHKAKLNSNGSFSVGKTWNLSELRALEAFSPQLFSVTLARTYRWQTDDPRSQVEFLTALVRLFRTVTAGSAPLQVAGFREPDAPSSSRQPSFTEQSRPARTPTPDATSNGLYGAARRPIAQAPSRDFEPTSRPASPPPRAQARAARPSVGASRPISPSLSLPPPVMPAASERNRTSSPSRARPPSPSSLSQSSAVARPRRPRAPSNATTNTRMSTSTTYSQAPSMMVPPSPSSVPRPFAMPQPSRTQSFESSQLPSSLSSRPSIDQPSSSSTSLAAPTVSELNVPTPLAKSRNQSSQSVNGQVRREPNARVSFFDPANQAVIDRLVTGDFAERESGEGGVEESESGQATLASVEEMLEGYEWASDDIIGKRARGPADQIEARLLDELMALEKANIYSFLESDDRVGLVLQYLDTAVNELDSMDSLLSSYKIHLNAVNDDISHIQSQNRGLQVQTQNQKALLNELEQLLQTVHVDRDTLIMLAQESLEKPAGIQRLEEAASELYKALQAGRDRDMAATMERLGEYQTHNIQFCKRLLDYLSIMFTAQSKMLLGDSDGLIKGARRGLPTVAEHRDLETYLARYSGLILYLKEMDESTYGKLCGNYFSAASELHAIQIKALLSVFATMVKKPSDDDADLGFSSTTPTSATFRPSAGIRRAGTMVRSGTVSRKDKDKDKTATEGNMRAAEAFSHVLERIAPQVYREEEFIAVFLQVNDAALTFADHMSMENYYRRQAARSAGMSAITAKLARGGMELVFGFLPAELKTWTDVALAKDGLQIMGIIAALERFLVDADERGNAFLVNLLEKQHTRLKTLFDRHINEQMKLVEQTKVTNKKRNGVAPFIKYFPTYISRVEAQLVGSDTLEIRASVDAAYEKLVSKMFDSLRQMAKMDGEGEDKGQLNYHVILIENMHHFVAEMAQVDLGSVSTFVRRAEGIYDENLTAYVKLVLRRPFAKLIDYFEGVERLLTTTAPSEVASNGTYSKSSLKKVTKEYNGKDVRKHVDSLFKRIEKHFTEASEKALTAEEKSSAIAPGTVLVGVWRACEDELLRLTETFNKLIAQCYKDSGVALEYSASDIEAAFKRHRVGA